MDKVELVETMKYIYANCDSYRDVCVVRYLKTRKENGDEVVDTGHKIATWFRRPMSFRVETSFFGNLQELKPGVPFSFVVGDEGGADVLLKSNLTSRAYEKRHYGSIEKALSPLPDHPVIELLKKAHFENIKGIVEFPKTRVAERMCRHLVIYHTKRMQETHVWIDELSHLIRKYEEPIPGHYRKVLSLPFEFFSLFPGVTKFDFQKNYEIEYLEVELNPQIDSNLFSLKG